MLNTKIFKYYNFREHYWSSITSGTYTGYKTLTTTIPDNCMFVTIKYGMEWSNKIVSHDIKFSISDNKITLIAPTAFDGFITFLNKSSISTVTVVEKDFAKTDWTLVSGSSPAEYRIDGYTGVPIYVARKEDDLFLFTDTENDINSTTNKVSLTTSLPFEGRVSLFVSNIVGE